MHWACTSDSNLSKSGSYSCCDLLPLSSESDLALSIELESEEVVVVTLNPVTCTSIGPHPKLLDVGDEYHEHSIRGIIGTTNKIQIKADFGNTANGVFNGGLVTSCKL